MKRDLRPEHARRLRRLVAGLNRLRADVGEYLPDVNFYLAGGTLHVMSGRPHDERGITPLYENSMDAVRLDDSSGGDW